MTFNQTNPANFPSAKQEPHLSYHHPLPLHCSSWPATGHGSQGPGGRKDSPFTRVIAVNFPELGWNMQPRLLSAVTMVTHERGAALSPPDLSLKEGENVTQSTRRGEKVLW